MGTRSALGEAHFLFRSHFGRSPPPRVRPLLDSYTAPDLYFSFSPSSFPSSSIARSSTETSFNTYSDHQTIRPLRPRNSLSLRKQKEKSQTKFSLQVSLCNYPRQELKDCGDCHLPDSN